ncbi:RNA recognition motif domain-containing protein [Longitalea luteola]|uniref:RNA recognition motif domain-containing protein n=1 Tax=Longitalea luteola TaxID=2812563 RepID=UPI001A96002B|nr:RNA-binding protein [Longitalea luteola]
MKIQIYNLGRDVNDAALRKLFSTFGIVNSAEVVRDKLNGRSKGNGVIEMPIEREAKQAIESLDQTIIVGKRISVSELRLPPEW